MEKLPKRRAQCFLNIPPQAAIPGTPTEMSCIAFDLVFNRRMPDNFFGHMSFRKTNGILKVFRMLNLNKELEAIFLVALS